MKKLNPSFSSILHTCSATAVKEKVLTSSLLKKIIGVFLRLTIARKMLLGYCSLWILLVFISFFALVNLKKLNSINNSILETNVPVLDASETLVDLVLEEELYFRRYLILETSEMINLFMDRKEEFNETIKKIQYIPQGEQFPFEEIITLHNEYSNIITRNMQDTNQSAALTPAGIDSLIREKQESLITLISNMADTALLDQNKKTGFTSAIGTIAFRISAVFCGFGLFLSITIAMLITRNISGSIKKLKFATEMISTGNFNYLPEINNKDELQDLSQAFITMAGKLKHMEEKSLDTSPLTRLPGGLAIERILEQRLANNTSFAFCLMDLDNFKAYNDTYGYAKGNHLIKASANIIQNAVYEFGNKDDFIGHIGGDDFVVITTPEKYVRICTAIIDNFDKSVLYFYSQEDIERGHIIGENRQGQVISFPIASISIAVVTDHDHQLDNYIKIGEIAAELKEHAKSIQGSVYVIDKRKTHKPDISDRSDTLIQFTKKKAASTGS